ncbi:hypothetical protein SLOPH_2663, partial [Spraguea lophii 42_110]
MDIAFQRSLLITTRKYNLPVSVQSTSIILYKMLKKKMNIVYHDMDLIYAFIIVSIKIESSYNTHNFLEIGNYDRILEYEKSIIRETNFHFNIPSPYLRLLGMVLVMQQKGLLEMCMQDENNPNVYYVGDVEAFYAESMKNLDRIILLPTYLRYHVNEIAIAALNIPEMFWGRIVENVRKENIRDIIEESKKIQ